MSPHELAIAMTKRNWHIRNAIQRHDRLRMDRVDAAEHRILALMTAKDAYRKARDSILGLPLSK